MLPESIVQKQLIEALFEDQLPTAAKKLAFLQGEKVWNSPSEFRASFNAELLETKQHYWERMSSGTQTLLMQLIGA